MPRPITCASRTSRYDVMRAPRRRDRHADGLRQHGRRPGRTGVRRRVVRARRARRADPPAAVFRGGAGTGRVRRRRAAAGRDARRRCRSEAEVYAALCLGVRDYVGKNGFPGVLLGLVRRHRFGADAGDRGCDALGRGQGARGDDAVAVHRGHQPGRRARDGQDAWACATTKFAIRPVFDAFLATLAGEFKGLPADTTEENIQARMRGTLLMALSNKIGAIVLTTGNKTEMARRLLPRSTATWRAVSRCSRTSAKTLVYRLAEYRNTLGAGDSASASSRARHRPNCGPTRPTRTACRRTRCWTRIMEAYVEQNLSPRGDRGAAASAEEDVRARGRTDPASTNTSAASRRSASASPSAASARTGAIRSPRATRKSSSRR